jgi:hypothetical protein
MHLFKDAANWVINTLSYVDYATVVRVGERRKGQHAVFCVLCAVSLLHILAY